MLSARYHSWVKNVREGSDHRRRELSRAMYAFTRSKLSVVGLAIVLFILLVTIFTPIIAPFPEDQGAVTHMADRLKPPSATRWFGTDDVGRDVFSRVVIASRLDLGLALSVMVITLLIGITLGAWAGISGGWVDEIIMRITDMFMTVPDIILALAIITAIGPGARNAIIALALVWWPGYSRLTRSLVLVIREEQYVEAAVTMGGFAVLDHHQTPDPQLHFTDLDSGLDGYWLRFTGSGWFRLPGIGCPASPTRMGCDDQ